MYLNFSYTPYIYRVLYTSLFLYIYLHSLFLTRKVRVARNPPTFPQLNASIEMNTESYIFPISVYIRAFTAPKRNEMTFQSAAIILQNAAGIKLSIHKKIGGSPHEFVHFLNRALSGRRRLAHSDPGYLATAISAGGGYDASQFYCFCNSDSAMDRPWIWLYEINISDLGDFHLRITQRIDDKEKVEFDGNLEHYLSKALRNRRPKPRGPTPKAYSSREEYETELASRFAGRPKESPPDSFKEQILAERKKEGIVPRVPAGVRELTPEELAERKRNRRRLKLRE